MNEKTEERENEFVVVCSSTCCDHWDCAPSLRMSDPAAAALTQTPCNSIPAADSLQATSRMVVHAGHGWCCCCLRCRSRCLGRQRAPAALAVFSQEVPPRRHGNHGVAAPLDGRRRPVLWLLSSAAGHASALLPFFLLLLLLLLLNRLFLRLRRF